MSELILGIDLGTTNSVAAVVRDGIPLVIRSREGEDYFPSIVCFKEGVAADAYTEVQDPETGRLLRALVGKTAREAGQHDSKLEVTRAKRLIGTDHTYLCSGQRYTPEEISALILKKIRDDAGRFLDELVIKARITVPAYFDMNQRQATREAGKLAGLEVVGLVSEPSAALVTYKHEGGLAGHEGQNVMVIDLGAGTLDVVIGSYSEFLSPFGDQLDLLNILSITGDPDLGGEDMTDSIKDLLLKNWKAKGRGELDTKAEDTLVQQSEAAKIQLSDQEKTYISVPRGPSATLTRAELNEIVEPIITRCQLPIVNAIKDALSKKGKGDDPHELELAKVILVGGPTKMPIVRERFKQFTGQTPATDIDPMKCVAIGAALWELEPRAPTEPLPFSYGYIQNQSFCELLSKGSDTPLTLEREMHVPPFSSRLVVHAALTKERHVTSGVSLGKYPFAVHEASSWTIVKVTFQVNEAQEVHITMSDPAGELSFPGISRRTRDPVQFTNFVDFGEEETGDELLPWQRLQNFAQYAIVLAYETARYPIGEHDLHEIERGASALASALNRVNAWNEAIPEALAVTIEGLARKLINNVENIELPPDPKRLGELKDASRELIDKAQAAGVNQVMVIALENALTLPERSDSHIRNKILSLERAKAPIEIELQDVSGFGGRQGLLGSGN